MSFDRFTLLRFRHLSRIRVWPVPAAGWASVGIHRGDTTGLPWCDAIEKSVALLVLSENIFRVVLNQNYD